MPSKTRRLIERYVFLEMEKEKLLANGVSESELHQLDDAIVDLIIVMNQVQFKLAKSVLYKQAKILRE